MIEVLIDLLILFVILALVWYVFKLVAAHFRIPEVFVHVAGIILFLVWLRYAIPALRSGKALGIFH